MTDKLRDIALPISILIFLLALATPDLYAWSQGNEPVTFTDSNDSQFLAKKVEHHNIGSL